MKQDIKVRKVKYERKNMNNKFQWSKQSQHNNGAKHELKGHLNVEGLLVITYVVLQRYKKKKEKKELRELQSKT